MTSPITNKNDDNSFGRIYTTVSDEYWSDSFFLLKQTVLAIGIGVFYAIYNYFYLIA